MADSIPRMNDKQSKQHTNIMAYLFWIRLLFKMIHLVSKFNEKNMFLYVDGFFSLWIQQKHFFLNTGLWVCRKVIKRLYNHFDRERKNEQVKRSQMALIYSKKACTLVAAYIIFDIAILQQK